MWRIDGPTSGQCIWNMHLVWEWDKVKKEGVVLREKYFTKDPATGKKVGNLLMPEQTYSLLIQIDWYTDFYFPFLRRWTDRVRSVSSPKKIVFVEAIPNEVCTHFNYRSML